MPLHRVVRKLRRRYLQYRIDQVGIDLVIGIERDPGCDRFAEREGQWMRLHAMQRRMDELS